MFPFSKHYIKRYLNCIGVSFFNPETFISDQFKLECTETCSKPNLVKTNKMLKACFFLISGRGPDGTLYKTDYRCEGENMTISCEDSDGPGLHGIISVVRANFGRFSIAICNRHGQTDWSVNCMAPQTTKILQQR